MAGKEKVNWLAVRTAYIVKGYTAQRCADEFGVDVTTVKKRASKEKWTDERHRITTQGHLVATEDMRAIVAEVSASHKAAANRQVILAELLAVKLEEAIRSVDGKDVSKLRSLIEAGKSLGEWTERGIISARLSDGLRPGDSSDGRDIGEADLGVIEFIIPAPPPKALETQTA